MDKNKKYVSAYMHAGPGWDPKDFVYDEDGRPYIELLEDTPENRAKYKKAREDANEFFQSLVRKQNNQD